MVFKVPIVTLWSDVAPFSIIATGVSGHFPLDIRSVTMVGRVFIPIRKTKVPSNLAIASKLCQVPSSIVCPVNT